MSSLSPEGMGPIQRSAFKATKTRVEPKTKTLRFQRRCRIYTLCVKDRVQGEESNAVTVDPAEFRPRRSKAAPSSLFSALEAFSLFEVLSIFEAFEAPAPSSPLKPVFSPSKPRSLRSRLDSVLESDVQRTPGPMVVHSNLPPGASSLSLFQELLDHLASPLLGNISQHTVPNQRKQSEGNFVSLSLFAHRGLTSENLRIDSWSVF